MKRVKWLVVALAVLPAAVLLAVNQLVKLEVRRALVRQTGFSIEIGSWDVGLLSTRAELRDVVVRNPPDFPEPVAFEIRRAYADINPWALLRRAAHVTDLELDIPRVVVVRNPEGETNLQRMSGGARKRGGGKDAPAPAPPPDETAGPGPKRDPALRIDRLRLKIGAVEYHDYRVKNPPGITKVTLDLDQEHKDIRRVSDIGPLIAQGVMENAAVRLFGDVGRSLKTALGDETLRKEMKKFGKDLKRIFEPSDE